MVAKRLRAWAAPLATAAVTATLALVDVTPAIAQRTMDEAIFGQPPSGYRPRHERTRSARPASYAPEGEIVEKEAPPVKGRAKPSAPPPEVEYEDEGTEIHEEWDGMGPEACRRMFWARGEYLYWGTKGYDVPALVTTSTSTGTGALSAAGTSVVFGNDQLQNDMRSGAKLTVGWELFTSTPAGIELSYFGLGKEETHFGLDTPSGITVARPFFNVRPASGLARQDAQLVSQPGNLAGAVNIDAVTEFQGGEALLRWTMCEAPCHVTEGMIGYRFLRLDDSLHIREDLRALSTTGGAVVGTTFNLFDLFDTENEFHGIEVGASSSHTRGRWTLETLLKLAIGNTRSVTDISGQTVVTVPSAGSSTSSGGLLSQPSNIGRYTTDNFSIVPELGVTLKYDITCNLQASVGYSFLYWSKVARVGDQIDTDVNLTQQPPGPTTGELRPTFPGVFNDFWAQGLNVGLEYTF